MTWITQSTQQLVASTSKACYSCGVRAARSRLGPGLGFSTSASTSRSELRSKHSNNEKERDLLQEVLAVNEGRSSRSVGVEERHAPRPLPTPHFAVPSWRAHRLSLKEQFPGGWNPPRKIGRSEMNVMRRLHGMNQVEWSTPKLADTFKISPEAVRRILKSKWRSEDELEEERIGDSLERQAEVPAEAHAPSLTADGEDGERYELPLPDLIGQAEEEPAVKQAVPLRAGFQIDRESKAYKWRKSRVYDDAEEAVDERRPRWRA